MFYLLNFQGSLQGLQSSLHSVSQIVTSVFTDLCMLSVIIVATLYKPPVIYLVIHISVCRGYVKGP